VKGVRAWPVGFFAWEVRILNRGHTVLNARIGREEEVRVGMSGCELS
jgi:hypothetical protein